MPDVKNYFEETHESGDNAAIFGGDVTFANSATVNQSGAQTFDGTVTFSPSSELIMNGIGVVTGGGPYTWDSHTIFGQESGVSLFLEATSAWEMLDVSTAHNVWVTAGINGTLNSLSYIFNDGPGTGTVNLTLFTQVGTNLGTAAIDATTVTPGTVGFINVNPDFPVSINTPLRFNTDGGSSGLSMLRFILIGQRN